MDFDPAGSQIGWSAAPSSSPPSGRPPLASRATRSGGAVLKAGALKLRCREILACLLSLMSWHGRSSDLVYAHFARRSPGRRDDPVGWKGRDACAVCSLTTFPSRSARRGTGIWIAPAPCDRPGRLGEDCSVWFNASSAATTRLIRIGARTEHPGGGSPALRRGLPLTVGPTARSATTPSCMAARSARTGAGRNGGDDPQRRGSDAARSSAPTPW